MWRNSSTLSKQAESDPPSITIGNNFFKSSSKSSDLQSASRARIQLILPRSVLISPLCATKRNGCASGQDGKVLVEKRECTKASADCSDSSPRSGYISSTWVGVNMPLYTS